MSSPQLTNFNRTKMLVEIMAFTAVSLWGLNWCCAPIRFQRKKEIKIYTKGGMHKLSVEKGFCQLSFSVQPLQEYTMSTLIQTRTPCSFREHMILNRSIRCNLQLVYEVKTYRFAIILPRSSKFY